MPGLRILIADDHEVVLEGLRTLLETQPGWQVIGEAKDGTEAIKKSAALKPDVIVLDISMPQLDGLAATREIVRLLPDAKILILSMHESENLIREVVEAGARGFVTKSSASRELVAAVEALQRGKTYFTPRLDQLGVTSFCRTDPNVGVIPDKRDSLTPRQKEVVQQLAEGRSSKEAAAALGVSVKTVETHRVNIMRRLGCHSVSDLTRYAIRNHIIEP